MESTTVRQVNDQSAGGEGAAAAAFGGAAAEPKDWGGGISGVYPDDKSYWKTNGGVAFNSSSAASTDTFFTQRLPGGNGPAEDKKV